MKKIGILTWHYYPNFGSGLQAYALQELIKGMGYDVRIVNYRNPQYGITSPVKDSIRFVLSKLLGWVVLRFRFAHLSYMHKYLKQTICVQNEHGLKDILKGFDVVVCGSDQIWAPNVFNPIYMAAFVNDNVEKVSYAASIGLRFIPTELVPQYKKYLTRFKSIAVREETGKKIIEDNLGLNAVVVLDPTLMHPVDKYRVMKRRIAGIKKPYVFCYFLNKDNNYRQKVLKYANENQLYIYGYSDKKSDEEWMNRLEGLGADEFLWLVDNAKTIFTDSYHATIFSLLFHKNFWTFVRFALNDPINQNSRIEQLVNDFGIGDRIITDEDDIDDARMLDFDYFEKQVEILRLSSIDYLNKALL